MLKGKTVVLGVTGSIAAYKIAGLASMLVKQHCDVHVVMTRNATNFISPITFETLTGNKCLTETFDRNFQFHVTHVSLAQKADLMMIAPASADMVAKLAHGIADDLLSTMALAASCPILVSPAMNVHMFENPIVQNNLAILRNYGFKVIEPDTGYLACGETGAGKMPSESVLMDYILKETACEKDLAGQRILVTAGPTRESMDPVRFITNHSTGKMGYAIARRAMLRGAQVTLVTGPVSIAPPPFVEVLPVTSAREMYETVMAEAGRQDIIIKAAAVADYTPVICSDHKLKKTDGEMCVELKRTRDILAELGASAIKDLFLCGFSMETEDMLENSRAKLEKKSIDMIVANNLKETGAGFGTDTNIITILTPKEQKTLPLLSKEEAADEILSEIQRIRIETTAKKS